MQGRRGEKKLGITSGMWQMGIQREEQNTAEETGGVGAASAGGGAWEPPKLASGMQSTNAASKVRMRHPACKVRMLKTDA